MQKMYYPSGVNIINMEAIRRGAVLYVT